MFNHLMIAIAERENLSELLLGGMDSHNFRHVTLDEVTSIKIPVRGALVGYWRAGSGNYFPDFMVVREDELADLQAWLSSFLNAVTPISQWCRLWTTSQFRALANVEDEVGIPHMLGAWVGAIVAECSAQATTNLSLKEISGNAVLTSASFCAARALAVWGSFGQFAELARRHDDLSGKLRDGHRPISAQQMMPLWFALAGNRWDAKEPSEGRSLIAFHRIFSRIADMGSDAPQHVVEIIHMVTEEFDLPELLECGMGPQTQRVDALDRLARRLLTGPKSASIEAILGFGASLIDLGAAVLPDLLRRYSTSYPLAPIWAGAFAGFWSPRRVLSDFNGLGRMIAKELLRPSDLFSAPSADISFDELSRWIGPSLQSRPPVRGMIARTLSVELLPGVSASFPIGRVEQSRPEGPYIRQRALELEEPKKGDRSTTQAPLTMIELAARVEELKDRLLELERKSRRSSSSSRSQTRSGNRGKNES